MSDFYTDEVEDTTDMENDLRTEGGASSSRLGVPGYHHHHHPSSIKQRQQVQSRDESPSVDVASFS